jgi:hypothetical protein
MLHLGAPAGRRIPAAAGAGAHERRSTGLNGVPESSVARLRPAQRIFRTAGSKEFGPERVIHRGFLQ